MESDKYFFNNCWNVNHPTINFFTFEAEVITVFGYKCILEKYQDGEIWNDDEYWGSVLYDFDNDRYIYISTYVNENEIEIEEILNRWTKINPYIWSKISKDFVNDKILSTNKTKWAIDFYKSYIASETDLDFENYYKQVYKLKENG